MRLEDRALILDMIDEAENVASFIAGRARADLDGNRMLAHALVRAIEVRGEAANKVSNETRAEAQDIPWKTIVAMRNRLIHRYRAIDPEVLWITATVNVPSVLPALRALAGVGAGG